MPSDASPDTGPDPEGVVRSLSLLDPVLRFLTHATGQTLVPLEALRATIPGLSGRVPFEDLVRLVGHGILRAEAGGVLGRNGGSNGCNHNDVLKEHWEQTPSPSKAEADPDQKDSASFLIGFPSGDANRKLCGSTKTAAKRRMAALRRCLREEERNRKTQTKPKTKTKTKPPSGNEPTRSSVSADEHKNANGSSNADASSAACDAPNNCSDGESLDDPGLSRNAAASQSATGNQTTGISGCSATSEANGRTAAGNEGPPLDDDEREARRALCDLLGLRPSGEPGPGTGTAKSKGGNRGIRAGGAGCAPSAADSSLFGPTPVPSSILPKQLSYAKTQPARSAVYQDECCHNDSDGEKGAVRKALVHPRLREAFRLAGNGGNDDGADAEAHPQRKRQRSRRLYRHQALAIASALADKHTLVCTGTGSGKSLCFLVPVLQAAISTRQTSLVLFPTKALAQDQLVKLRALLEDHPSLAEHVTAAALDGDTPRSERSLIAETCNVIFTNPDTLHASVLPSWETQPGYGAMLSNLRYVVLDEAHVYEGVFGAHVAMILARLYRIHCVAAGTADRTNTGGGCQDDESVLGENPPSHTDNSTDNSDSGIDTFNDSDNNDHQQAPESLSFSPLVFLACSATLAHPEHHFRLLCPIPPSKPVTVLTEDFSPRAAKHFFVWNPPLLDEHGKSLGYVAWPEKKKSRPDRQKTGGERQKTPASNVPNDASVPGPRSLPLQPGGEAKNPPRRREVRRRHSADETALLLARAVAKGVRCIAFCKTRCLVEWVYERCLKALKQSPETADLVSKVDSYRGGYSKSKRREIEEKLFCNQLLGVVGTSALELGVDIGGVGLTLHCGFPSSHASLMQQAGRAGRGAEASREPSLAICVCFNSPIDQHLWRHPTSLLSGGLSAPLSMPVYPGLVQGHLVCAGKEFPLTGRFNASAILTVEEKQADGLLSDEELFGSKEVYLEALENSTSKGSFSMEKVAVFGGIFIAVFKTHPSIKNPWRDVSIRSIETVNYDIVDLSHPMQGNRMDGNHHEGAIMDNIPYSRVFYHAFPGAIITHRGRRYKIVSMTRPPAFGVGFRSTVTLGAYAKPSAHRYCTRPLSNLKITVVKQTERVDLMDKVTTTKESDQTPDPSTIFADDFDPSSGSFAGCGTITVKRNVHGYKKISLVTRDELSRAELSLPDMEYDTYAFWIDCDATGLGKLMTPQSFGYGVHALSHALCNVAPRFVPCVLNDVQCDHSFYSPTRVVIFDSRAGGSGITAQLWKSIFRPNGLVEAAIDLLESCPSCVDDAGYTGGCPACIQAGECIKFNDFLCRSSGLIIARHMLRRLEKTERYKLAMEEHAESDVEMVEDDRKKRKENRPFASPRREKRRRAMRAAMDIDATKPRQLVIGRPSWPMDCCDSIPRQQQEG
ncbi:unnamed protein product [Pseudo-nitzschia multistriata]|uniref:Uncharacterized protein n=1 Tax=Pseudo-nitzschia multistriata TaxID=183589 RepID=A0A448Z326_9STRA|nr:unnamed protein product [Pseudo-nitzschia multistriata]